MVRIRIKITQEKEYYILTDILDNVETYLLISWGRPELFGTKLELLQILLRRARSTYTSYVRNGKGKNSAFVHMEGLRERIEAEEIRIS